MEEDEFRDHLVHDLESKGINVVNLRRGTFDLIVEGTRPFTCEVKQIAEGGLRGFKEDEEGFAFSSEQTKEILKIKFPPFVVAYHGNDFYFLDPEWVKREVTDLKEFERAIMYFSVRPFPRPQTYDELLSAIVRFVTR